MGLWGLLDRVTSWLPILTPAQRRRANINKIKREIKELHAQPWTPDRSKRVTALHVKLDKLLDEAANQ